VARQFSASVSSVHRWWQAYRRAGARRLRPKPIPDAAGYRTDLWTLLRVAEVIRQHLGVRYHRAHV
jgi:transposase